MTTSCLLCPIVSEIHWDAGASANNSKPDAILTQCLCSSYEVLPCLELVAEVEHQLQGRLSLVPSPPLGALASSRKLLLEPAVGDMVCGGHLQEDPVGALGALESLGKGFLLGAQVAGPSPCHLGAAAPQRAEWIRVIRSAAW